MRLLRSIRGPLPEFVELLDYQDYQIKQAFAPPPPGTREVLPKGGVFIIA